MFAFFCALLLQVSATDFKHHGRFYVSGTPSEAELQAFKKEKGAAVLDLRAMDELGDCREPAASAKLGLQYGRVNFAKTPAIDPEVVAGIDRAVAASGDKPMLLFCKTGNRAAAWLAIHMVRDEKTPLEEALATARGLGLKDDMEKAVRAYLRRPENTSVTSSMR